MLKGSSNITELKRIQQSLRKYVILNDCFGEIKLVGGVDVAYIPEKDKVIGALVILDFNSLEIKEESIVIQDISYPYIPGLFSFRELPPLLKAINKCKIIPDLIVCDGHGIAHPERFGLASHLGVETGIPTIGCGKSRLCGKYDEPGIKKGDYTELKDNGEIIGNVLRTQDKIKPVFVSPGHKVDFKTSRNIILKLCPNYRLPETTRVADQLVNKIKKSQVY